MKILVLVRRYRKNQSEADEHDFNYTKKTLKEIEKSKKNIKIKFDTLKTIILKLKSEYEIEKIIGHYQVDDKKECPSFDVPKWLEKNNL